jgi:hypothetical protein
MVTLWSSTVGQALVGRGFGAAAWVDAGSGFVVGALPGRSPVWPGAVPDEPGAAAAEAVAVGAGTGSAAGIAAGVAVGLPAAVRAAALAETDADGVGVVVGVGDVVVGARGASPPEALGSAGATGPGSSGPRPGMARRFIPTGSTSATTTSTA